VVLNQTDTAEAGSPASAETASAPDVTLRAIRKTYGDVVAVDTVDLEVAQGEFFTMLGPPARARRPLSASSPDSSGRIRAASCSVARTGRAAASSGTTGASSSSMGRR
jgi:ABC-type sugar transport system ATPase subunit